MSISVILPKTGFQTAGTIINGIARTLDIPDYLALNHINTTRKIAGMVICKMLQLTYGLQERAIGVLNSKMSIRAVARAFTTANRPHAQRFHVTAPTPSRRSLRTSKSVYSFHEFCLKLSQIDWWKSICTRVAFDVKWTSPLLDDDSGLKWINPWMSTHLSMSIVDTSVEGGCLPITNIPGICFQISWNRMLYYSTGQGGPLETHWRVPGLSGSLVFLLFRWPINKRFIQWHICNVCWFLPEASFGLRVLSLPASVRPSASPSVTKFVRSITQYRFKLGSLNLDHMCIRPWLRSLLFLGLIDFDLQGQI